MSKYSELLRDQRIAAMNELIVATLSMFDDVSLDTLNLPPSVLRDIDVARAGDDSVGVAVAAFSLAVSNYNLTDQDRLVASQIFAAASACTQRKMVVTKTLLDSQNVLLNRNILDSIYEWFKEQDATYNLNGDALEEESERLLKYVSQYNRTILDKSREWWKSNATNEDETANPYPSLLDYFWPG